jgi:hypothetical protein
MSDEYQNQKGFDLPSLFKRSEKDDHEEEEEEVERNVRESPKDKPPRRDKERRTVEQDDPDIDGDPDVSEDKDLSMNYKDIGGSLNSPRSESAFQIAYRYLKSADDNADGSEDEGKNEEDSSSNGEENGGNGDNNDGNSGNEKDDKSNESDEGGSNEDGGEEQTSTDEEIKKKPDEIDRLFSIGDGAEDSASDMFDRIVEHSLTGAETNLAKPVQDLARDWYEESPEELSSVLLSRDAEDKEKEAARRAFEMKKSALPPSWEEGDVFEAGVLTLEARRDFRQHMDNWSIKDFDDNIEQVRKRSISEAILDGSDMKEDYYESILEVMEDKRESVLDNPYGALDSLEEAIPDEVFGEYGQVEYTSDAKSELKELTKRWRGQLKETSFEETESLLKEVRDRLSQMGNSLTIRYAYLSVLWSLLKGAYIMKKMSKKEDPDNKTSSNKTSSQRKTSEYRGLPGPLPEEEQPTQTEWRKPDPLSLDVDDYMIILSEAQSWFEHDPKMGELRSYDREMACRISLDYAIRDVHDGLYDGVVDTPVYNDLLDLMIQRNK